MNDKVRDEGFEAQSQNTPREDNPYIELALAWDKGWYSRKIQELVHTLEGDKVPNLGSLEIGIVRNSTLVGG